MIPGKKYTPEDLLLLAWRSKWLLVVPLILGGLGASVWAHYQPDMFLSETLILVVPQRVPENYVRSTVTTRLQDRLQSINAANPQPHPPRADHPGPQPLPGDPSSRIHGRGRRADAQGDHGPAGQRRCVQDCIREPAAAPGAMQVTERLASLFIDESLKDREVLAEGTNQFLETQLQDARQRLIEHEKKLEQYNRQHARRTADADELEPAGA